MPMAIPALIAWGVGALTTAQLIVSVAVTAVSTLAQRQARKKSERQARDAWNASIQDRNVLIRSSIAPRKIIYGEVATNGTLVFVQSTGALNEVLTTVTVVAAHEIDSYTHIYLDKEDILPLEVGGAAKAGGRYNQLLTSQQAITSIVPSGGNATLPVTPASIQGISTRIADNADFGPGIDVSFTWVSGTSITNIPAQYNGETLFVTYTPAGAQVPYVWALPMLGAPGQVAWDWLVANSAGKWTSNHRGDGIAYVGLNYAYGDAVFPNGAPPVRYVVRGMKCYDPRTATTVWTANPAIILRDYLLSDIGFRLSSDEVDDAAIIAAANICDEQVAIDLGGTIFQPRYRCNTELSMESNRWDNLQILLSSMAGEVTYSQGKWIVFAGAYTAPVMSLNEDDVCGEEIQIVARAARAELFNEVRGIYVDPTKDWQPTDFPPVRNSFYEADDGGERLPNEIVLPATTDGLMAQRVAKILLEDARQALVVRAPFKWKAYPLQPGDNVTLTIARYGFSNKVFKIIEREFDPTIGVMLTLKEENSQIYEWNFGNMTVVDPAPNSNLPNPYDVPAITGVLLFSGNSALQKLADGTIVSRIRVEWDAIDDPAVVNGGHVEIAYRDAGEETWHAIPNANGNDVSAYIAPVLDGGIYYVRIRAVNAIGGKGYWQHYSTTVVGKTAAPTNLSAFTLEILPDGSRRFTITAPLGVADGAVIRVKYVTGSSSSWAAMADFRSLIYDDKISTYMFETSEPPIGTWSFGAKLFDTTGNESTGVFITGADLAQHPIAGGTVIFRNTINMLLNADFTHNVGYGGNTGYTDGRALNYWDVQAAGLHTSWGRNWNNGTYWNIGRGGAWAYQGAPETGHYSYAQQQVPALGGVDYECSVYVSIHRCEVQMYLRFYDSSWGHLGDAQGGPDVEDAGTSIVGSPTDIFSNTRLFRRGVSPVGTAWILVLLLKNNTTAGEASSYAFWHMGMVAAARADAVSRATATPWVPSNAVEDTEVGTPGLGPSAATDVLESRPAASSTSWSGVAAHQYTIASLSWTNNTGAAVFVAMHATGTFQHNGTEYADDRSFAQMRVLVDSVGVFGGAANNADLNMRRDAINKYQTWSANFSYTIANGSTLAASVRVDWDKLAGTGSGTIYFNSVTLQIQGIKR